MVYVFYIGIVTLMVATLLVVVYGVASLAANKGRVNRKKNNKLMMLRVALQGITIIILAAAYFIKNS